MNGGIYLIQDDGQLVELREQAYGSEDLLQQLLARYPNLLSRGPDEPGSTPALVAGQARERGSIRGGRCRPMGSGSSLSRPGCVPTLVEVKRSTDTRIRREVIGQMLDYAANAVAYWPVKTLRAQFEASCSESHSSEEVLKEFLGPDADEEQFWQQTKTNLQAGKIRLVFVADAIPVELKRIVEFLNSQMDPAEVLAVELKQYTGKGVKTLVPRVIGQTAEAQQKKAPGSTAKQWDEASFFQKLESKHGPNEAAVAKLVLEWAKSEGLRIWWGKGRIDGSFYPMLDHHGETFYTVGVWTYGTIEIPFQMMQAKAPFNDEAKRTELLGRLNELQGSSIPLQAITKRPSIRLHLLQDAKILAQFIEVLGWLCDQVRVT